jgi:cytochrome c oxidase subunit II
LAQVTRPHQKGLGPGFWPVTILLGVISLATAIWIATQPLDWLVPGASLHVANRADDIDFLFRFMSFFSSIIMIYVAGYVVYFAIAFRRRRDEPSNSVGVQIHDAPALELWWTVLPTVLVVILAVMSVQVWSRVQFGQGGAPYEVEVVGHQFSFEFRYPELKNSVWNEMHLPLGQPVRVLVSSADVLHSWWVPEFRLKADTVPGLVQNLNFTPTREGTYLIECTEFCGVNHSQMQAKLVVDSPTAFSKWLDAQRSGKNASGGLGGRIPGTGDARRGKALFAQKCVACHKIAPFDQKLVGPGLGQVFTDKSHPTLVNGQTVSSAHVADLIQHGYNGGAAGVMPDAQQNGLSGSDIADLAAYLASLK